MARVVLKNIWKVYERDNVAVRNVNLAIADGEFMVLVGPSGCGKSTTLRMIAGLEDISSGTVEIDGTAVNDVAPRDRDIAMVFQSYALYPHMSVKDNMTFALRIRKAAGDLVGKRLRMAADILGLGEYLERKPRALSGGQRQRVAMGRAIVREPKVFLFDEPLSNLDAKMRVEMRREILKLHRQVNATMIYVTHDQVEAMTLGDRICIMERGIIRQVGTPGEVFDNPKNLFVAGFIGTPPMNLIDGKLESEGESIVFSAGSLRAVLPDELAEKVRDRAGAEVVLGLRPKSFQPTDDETDGWNAVPEIAELLGEESLVHAKSGDARFVVSMDPQKLPEIDKPFLIKPLMNRAHIFDAESGENLTLGLNIPGRYSIRR
jgi:ABC-type sugar transport systems, ATPase components